MKKPEITIILKFKETIKVECFKENFLNANALSNCGADLVRTRSKENKIIIDFYHVSNKRRIFRYKKLLMDLAKCINSMEEIHILQLELFKRFKGTILDMQGMEKRFENLQNYYKKLTNNE